ncbi:GNAT family N-acetyltransferase, partial [Enterococcus faecalis]
DKISFKIGETHYPNTVPVPGMFLWLPVDHPDVFDVYARFARQNLGALIRSAFNWEEYWRVENEELRTAAVFYGAYKEP